MVEMGGGATVELASLKADFNHPRVNSSVYLMEVLVQAGSWAQNAALIRDVDDRE